MKGGTLGIYSPKMGTSVEVWARLILLDYLFFSRRGKLRDLGGGETLKILGTWSIFLAFAFADHFLPTQAGRRVLVFRK